MPKLNECRILITGTQGQVGYELIKALSGTGAHLVLAARRPSSLSTFGFPTVDLDLEDRERISKVIAEVKPDIVVNPAAYTAVDRAEDDLIRAYNLNHRAPLVMAECMAARNGALVHYSTDYVYNPLHERPSQENDPTTPCNVYGLSKLAGERAIMQSSASAIIFRTSWVYGINGNNFVKTMIRLAKEREVLKVVDDQIGCPTSAVTLAQGIASVLTQGFDDPIGFIKSKKGIYNICDEGVTSWKGFANEIFKIVLELGVELKISEVGGIKTVDYKTAATRPLNSRLDLEKLKKDLNFFPPDWQNSLRLFLHQAMIQIT